MSETAERIDEPIVETPEPSKEPVREPSKTVLDTEPEIKPLKDWPEDWRDKLSKGDEKRANVFGRYSSVEALGDALIAANQRISSGELKPSLPANPTPEQLTEWRKANGIPEKPEEYDLKFDNGLVIGDEDKAFVNEFLQTAHSKNMSPDHVKATVEWFFGLQEQMAEKRAEQDSRESQEATNALIADYGKEFPRNKNLVNGFLNRFPPEVKEKLLSARDANGSALFNDPEVFRAILASELQLNPQGIVVPGGEGDLNQSIKDRMEELQKWRTAPRGSREYKKYWEQGGDKEYVKLLSHVERQNTK